jgi:aldehyde dehydrogenase (NAD+)
MATGNCCVILPSERYAPIATDFYQVLDTSDVPGGVVNIVTGDKRTLAAELAKHDAVDAIWYFGNRDGATEIEKLSAGNLKQSWTETVARDWSDQTIGAGRDILRHATQVKNIWIPYGE